ncbi:MAG: hypothetical protein JW900_05940 [Anaerolineae bacterium]|nr:hypothetical protein [Anaerolineae bacterium]
MNRTRLLTQCFLLLLLLALPAQAAVGPAPTGVPETPAPAVKNAASRPQVDPAAPAAWAPPPGAGPAGYDPVAENTAFWLYVDPATLAFQVVDKRSGYTWYSSLAERAEDDRLNKTWTAFAQSGLSIDYLDQKANTKRAAIANAEHVLEIRPIANGIHAEIAFTEAAISLGLDLILEETGVRVEVPFATIREDGDFRLGMLHLYPWMGATRGGDTPGYMFLPTGCGSLIHFAAETKAQNMYYGRYYGADLGMAVSLPYDPTVRRPYPLSLPVIGMVHVEGQNAYLAVLEKGASYAEIQGHPAGIITNFNFLYNAFIYNESYFQRTNRAGDGVTVIQPRTNPYDIVLHYRFLTGAEADYVGMARSYQRYLLEKGLLRRQDMPADGIGIRLEFLAAEQEKILFWNRTIPMTTLPQMEQILGELQVAGPQVIYYGWQPGGASAMPSTHLWLDRALGSVADLREAAERVNARGGTLALYLDPLAAIRDQGSYSRHDLAVAITGDYLDGYRRGKRNYYLSFAALEARLAALSSEVQEKLPAGLALDNIGATLYADFRRGSPLSREETIAAYQGLLAGSPVPIALYTPNDFLFAHARAYYDIPITDNGYIYTTATVPFLQIVLSGYVPYYGEALNFSPDVRGDLLRHAEYGVYPSFFLTHEETARILETGSYWIYVSAYRQMEADIEDGYAWLNALLEPVRGASIVGHGQIAPQVFATTYSNGKQLLVNYGAGPVTLGDLTVPARDAALREVNP